MLAGIFFSWRCNTAVCRGQISLPSSIDGKSSPLVRVRVRYVSKYAREKLVLEARMGFVGCRATVVAGLRRSSVSASG